LYKVFERSAIRLLHLADGIFRICSILRMSCY